jgi:hypothetical protein
LRRLNPRPASTTPTSGHEKANAKHYPFVEGGTWRLRGQVKLT